MARPRWPRKASSTARSSNAPSTSERSTSPPASRPACPAKIPLKTYPVTVVDGERPDRGADNAPPSRSRSRARSNPRGDRWRRRGGAPRPSAPRRTRLRILKAAAHLIRAPRLCAASEPLKSPPRPARSRGAQLHHFPTKDLLVVATLEYVFEQAQIAQPPPRRRDQSAARSDRSRHRGRQGVLLQRALHGGDRHRAIDLHRPGRAQARSSTSRARRAGPVEAAWAEALAAGGVPAAVAADIVALTLGVVRGMAVRTLWDNDPEMVRSAVRALAAHDQGLPRNRAKAWSAAMSSNVTGRNPLVTSVCYVRLAVRRAAGRRPLCVRHLWPASGSPIRTVSCSFRSDDRFRTVGLSCERHDGGQRRRSRSGTTPPLQEIGERLREQGFAAWPRSPDECRRRYVQSALCWPTTPPAIALTS